MNLTSLPTELLIQIFSNLDLVAHKRLERVNSYIQCIIRYQYIPAFKEIQFKVGPQKCDIPGHESCSCYPGISQWKIPLHPIWRTCTEKNSDWNESWCMGHYPYPDRENELGRRKYLTVAMSLCMHHDDSWKICSMDALQWFEANGYQNPVINDFITMPALKTVVVELYRYCDDENYLMMVVENSAGVTIKDVILKLFSESFVDRLCAKDYESEEPIIHNMFEQRRSLECLEDLIDAIDAHRCYLGLGEC